MSELEKLVSVIGANVIAGACHISESAVHKWIKNGAVPRWHHPALESLARDKKCFRLYRQAVRAKR